MELPELHPGLILSYSFLWAEEHDAGKEDGRKGRPCAIVLTSAVADGKTAVTVVPITHAPHYDGDALEIPTAVAKIAGLDEEKAWVVVNELNTFLWPGPDLAPIPGRKPEACAYGTLPPGFFQKIKEAILAASKRRLIQRTE